MFNKTVRFTTLFVVCALSFLIRVHFEIPGSGGLSQQMNGIGLPYQPSFLVGGLGFSSVILLAASPALFGKEWFASCILDANWRCRTRPAKAYQQGRVPALRKPLGTEVETRIR